MKVPISPHSCQNYHCLVIAILVSISEKAVATHSSTLASKIPWTKEPGRLQSMGSLGVGHDWATSLSLSCIGEGNGNPLQCSRLENPRDGGAWGAAVHGVAQSRTLKRPSSSSSSGFRSQTAGERRLREHSSKKRPSNCLLIEHFSVNILLGISTALYQYFNGSLLETT